MADYIERQAAIDAFNRIKNTLKNPETAHYDTLMFYEIEDVLEDVEPADVVQVVRCKDCKHVYCRIYHGWQEPIYTCTHLRSRWNSNNDLDVNPDDFCSYGGRKE